MTSRQTSITDGQLDKQAGMTSRQTVITDRQTNRQKERQPERCWGKLLHIITENRQFPPLMMFEPASLGSLPLSRLIIIETFPTFYSYCLSCKRKLVDCPFEEGKSIGSNPTEKWGNGSIELAIYGYELHKANTYQGLSSKI
jgi:hypothetical protein